MATPRKKLPIIGSVDRLDLPEFGLVDVPCKIDTGALTSSIHCERFKIVERSGKDFLSVKLLDKRFKHQDRKILWFEKFMEKRFRSSFGDMEYRYAIKTSVVLFGKSYKITFTLSDRGEMTYPILLGKRFIRNKFLVDVRQENLSYQQKLAQNT